MEKKTWKKTLCALLAAVLLLAAMPLAGAEEPHGDGNGILSRPLLASLYKWLEGMDGNFRALLTFDEISNAVGKWGCLKEKSGEDTHAAYWTDGEDYVTVTFRNRDGYWGVTSIVTDLPREEYMAADASFLPPVGNREAGSSPAEPVTMATQVKPSGEEASVTVQLPAENWFAKESFGELRYLNAPDESRVSSNSSGLWLSLWSDAESLRAEQEKGANGSVVVIGEDEPAADGGSASAAEVSADTENSTAVAAEVSEAETSEEDGAEPEIVITIPSGVGLDTLRIAMENGKLIMTDITANSVTIQSGGGSLVMKDVSLGTVDIYTDAGSVSVSECTFNSLNIGMAEGQVEVDSDESLARCRMEIKTGDGEISYNGTSEGDQYMQPGNGKRFLTIQVGSGDISIKG